MSPARRTALASVLAAAVLIAIKLAVGLATNSLGLIGEAVHSGTDLAAALLTFFALGVAGRPADASHAWGHGKAEHLSALAEAVILAAAAGVVIWHAVHRLSGDPAQISTPWYAFAVVGVVIAVDAARMVVSLRAARRYSSPALHANAVHFGADLAGTLAVLTGLVLTRAGHPAADAVAALFVAGLVLIAAGRLVKSNVDILMDRTPGDAERAARTAIERLVHEVTLERLRVRSAAGRHFVDAVVTISPSAALAEGHALADAVEDAVRLVLPNADVVVHVEPGSDPQSLPGRALAAALGVPGVREIHNVRVIRHDDGVHVSLHLKVPSDATLSAAHDQADQVEAAIRAAMPEVVEVTSHLEPLSESVTVARTAADANIDAAIHVIVRELTGSDPLGLRTVVTDDGVVAFVTVALDGGHSIVEAHEIGGAVRARLRAEVPGVHDVLVHTEPRP